MSKHISEAGWKAWTKGRTLDDKALLTKLSTLGKTPEDKPKDRLDILGQVDKEIAKLGQAHRADKAMQKHLSEVLSELKQQRQLAMLALERQRHQDARQGQGDDDAGDGPALLHAKLFEHLKLVRNTDGLVRHAVIGLAGKEVAVALSKAPATPAVGAMLKAHLHAERQASFTA